MCSLYLETFNICNIWLHYIYKRPKRLLWFIAYSCYYHQKDNLFYGVFAIKAAI